MSELIKEETITEEITKEEKLTNLLTNIDNKKLQKKAALLYKCNLYDRNVVDKFDEASYTDVTYNDGYKGYALFKDCENNLLMVKELNAEAGEDTYAYEVLTLAQVSDEEIHKIHHYVHRHPVLFYTLIGVLGLMLFIALAVMFIVFFETVSAQGFMLALATSYSYAGGYFTVGLGLLILALKSLKCGKGPRK